MSYVQAVQLLAVRERYLRYTSELSQEHLELMSHLGITVQMASFGMLCSQEKGRSAAHCAEERLQSNMQRSSNAFVALVQECLLDVLNPFQVIFASSACIILSHMNRPGYVIVLPAQMS